MLLKVSKIFMWIVVIATLSLCILNTWYILNNWDSCRFYSVRAIEAINVFILLLIALYVSYYTNRKIDDEAKRKEIAFDLLADFENKIKGISSVAAAYFKSPDANHYNEVIIECKSASNQLTLIERAKDKYLLSELKCANIEELNRLFDKLETALTGQFFSALETEARHEIINSFRTTLGNLISRIKECQINLYPT